MIPILAAAALAQDPELFALDPVFVSRFEARESDLDPVARRVRTLLETRLATQFILIGREEVPAFEDYSAEVYLSSCPADQFYGCAFVVGTRAQAEWVVTGEVEAGLDDGVSPTVTVVIIDVTDSEVVFSFQVQLDTGNEQAFADGVAQVVDQIIRGAAEAKDIRDETPEEKARRERLQREALSQSLSEMEGELGAMERSDFGDVEAPRFTAEDIAQYRDAEEATPWERAGLSEAQYIRYRNSGRTLVDYRERLRGRQARVIAGVGAGVLAGPWSENFSAQQGLDRTTLEPIEIVQFQEVINGGGIATDFEVGFGVHSWVDVGLLAGFRSSVYSYSTQSQVQDQTAPSPVANEARFTSWQLGVRATFAPMPTWSFRPTGSLGVSSWKGIANDRVFGLNEGMVPMAAPTQVFLDVGPGVEIDASKLITLYGRAMLAVPVAGRRIEQYQDGPAIVSERAEPLNDRGPGFAITGGVRLRLPPLWSEKAPDSSLGEDEDEPPEDL